VLCFHPILTGHRTDDLNNDLNNSQAEFFDEDMGQLENFPSDCKLNSLVGVRKMSSSRYNFQQFGTQLSSSIFCAPSWAFGVALERSF
jgi:hypothetical protein